MRVRKRRLAAGGAGVAAAGVLAWLVRTRSALVRAVLIRVAMVLEDVVRLGQIAVLRLFRRSAAPLLIPFVGTCPTDVPLVGIRRSPRIPLRPELQAW